MIFDPYNPMQVPETLEMGNLGVTVQYGGCREAVRFPDLSAGRVMVYPSAVLQTRVQIPLSTNF